MAARTRTGTEEDLHLLVAALAEAGIRVPDLRSPPSATTTTTTTTTSEAAAATRDQLLGLRRIAKTAGWRRGATKHRHHPSWLGYGTKLGGTDVVYYLPDTYEALATVTGTRPDFVECKTVQHGRSVFVMGTYGKPLPFGPFWDDDAFLNPGDDDDGGDRDCNHDRNSDRDRADRHDADYDEKLLALSKLPAPIRLTFSVARSFQKSVAPANDPTRARFHGWKSAFRTVRMAVERENKYARILGRLFDVNMDEIVLAKTTSVTLLKTICEVNLQSRSSFSLSSSSTSSSSSSSLSPSSSTLLSHIRRLVAIEGLATEGPERDVRQSFLVALALHLREDPPDGANGWLVNTDPFSPNANWRRSWERFRDEHGGIDLYARVRDRADKGEL